jgi:hypothetical protein
LARAFVARTFFGASVDAAYGDKMLERSAAGGRRSKLRYPSDLTDEEWVLIGPLIPPPKKGGNKRAVINGVHRT